MGDNLIRLLNKYRPLGIVKAGELLLRPGDALRFADDLEAIGIVILGVDIWYYVDNLIAEDPYGLNLSEILHEANPVQKSVAAAKHYISTQLPERIAFVSFVMDDPDWAISSDQA